MRHGEQAGATPFELAVLPHDERRVRRRLIPLIHGDGVLVDLPEVTTLDNRDCLRLDDGRLVEIIAAEELLYDVRGRDDLHVTRLAWHLGNRHLPTEIQAERLLIRDDHVIAAMLRGLGATLRKVEAPFNPEGGAYGEHNRQPGHHHHHHHDGHDHDHHH